MNGEIQSQRKHSLINKGVSLLTYNENYYRD